MIKLSFFIVIGLGLGGAVAQLTAAAPASDLVSPLKRRPVVDTAIRLVATAPVQTLSPGFVHPFNPEAFGQPDPEELRAIAAAQAAAALSAQQAKPAGNRDVLDLIAGRINPTGVLIMDGQPLLFFGQKRVRVGDRLTVTYEEQDYTLEITAIERSTFTLRLNNDEITRRINAGK